MQGDCLELMKNIQNKSIDMIFCDLPYGTTQNEWDSIIPLDNLWKHYNRIIKQNGVIVLFATEPFTSSLIFSKLDMYKYKWIWEKSKATNFLNAKRQPLRKFEELLIFYKSHQHIILNTKKENLTTRVLEKTSRLAVMENLIL